MIRIVLTSAVLLGIPGLSTTAGAGSPGPRPQGSGGAAGEAQAGPPGLILVPGGRTTVGSEVDHVESLIPRIREARASLAAETPRGKVEVESFYLMPTEVTNEQYAAFARATDAKPPHYWAEASVLDEARRQFAEQQEELRRAALAEGKRFERAVFDQQRWWEKNWREHPWRVPQDKLTQPVYHVSYADVTNYARWAGLRLMTEFEYARASRGESDRTYPWGDEWKASAAAVRQAGRAEPWPVGSFPEGAVNGIYDLCGNVWEWTSSPYSQFDGYKQIRVEVGKGKQKEVIEALGDFDSNWRVAVGGSFANDEVAARISTRRGTDRFQATEGLGFRCAASVQPGVDPARSVMERDVRLGVLPADQEVTLYPEGTVVKHRWRTSPGTSEVEGYALIEGYDRVLFVPVLTAPVLAVKDLRSDSTGMPIVLGLLSTTEPVVEPALAPGSYFVAFRGAGSLPRKEKEEEGEEKAQEDGPVAPQSFVEWAATPGLDTAKDCLVFFDLTGAPVLAVPAGSLEDKPMREKGSARVELFVPPPVDPDAEEPPPPVTPLDTLVLRLGIAGKQRTKGIWLDLPLKVATDGIATWP